MLSYLLSALTEFLGRFLLGRFLKRIPVVDLVLLFMFISSGYAGVTILRESHDDFSTFKEHAGVVENKYLVREVTYDSDNRPDSVIIAKLKLAGDPGEYSVSGYAIAVDNLVHIGDSVQLFTKTTSYWYGNMVATAGGRGGSTHDQNEVFHLLSRQYSMPIIDFRQNQENLKDVVWMIFVFSFVFLGWFLLRCLDRMNAFSKT